jgi:hypothetical protein
MPDELDSEDAKLVTLARGSRGRVAAPEGAAVRDETGRTYTSATVSLPSLHLTALQAAVAQAVSSGAGGLEAAVVVTALEHLDTDGLSAVRDLGGLGVPVLLVDLSGEVRTAHRT